jgi:CubicO group peptidase (beta-lactamase class C family)
MLSMKTIRGIVAGGAGALVVPSVLAAQLAGGAPAPRLDSLVQATQQALGAPAISVAVAAGGRVAYSGAFGVADLEHTVLATPATVYRVASVAKPFTAAAVLRLVERGKLELDRSIRAYVPELPASYDPVTLRDLLRHTGGVRHYRDNAEFVTTRHCDSIAQALPIFATDPLEHGPGEKITYSSYGYTLLGLAVERASGQRYEEFVRTTIFEPVGMRNTRLDDFDIIRHRARGYRRAGGAVLKNAPPLDVSCRVPAGGFVSTAEDLVRFAAALEAGDLLDPRWAREMMQSHLTPAIIARTLAGLQVPPGFQPPGMGFGWAIEPDGRAAYHGGNQPGFTSMLYHVPSRDLSVAVIINIDGAGDELAELARRIATVYAAGGRE